MAILAACAYFRLLSWQIAAKSPKKRFIDSLYKFFFGHA